MHFTAKIRNISYGWHLTAFINYSHLPGFRLCMPDVHVAPVRFHFCYVNIGIHLYLEITPESFILDSNFKFSSFMITKVSKKSQPNPQKVLFRHFGVTSGYQ